MIQQDKYVIVQESNGSHCLEDRGKMLIKWKQKNENQNKFWDI